MGDWLTDQSILGNDKADDERSDLKYKHVHVHIDVDVVGEAGTSNDTLPKEVETEDKRRKVRLSSGGPGVPSQGTRRASFRHNHVASVVADGKVEAAVIAARKRGACMLEMAKVSASGHRESGHLISKAQADIEIYQNETHAWKLSECKS
jgi:hypothetical protein